MSNAPRTGTATTATGGSHSCAILNDGSVTCWGRNSAGQLGDGMAPSDALRPSPVSGVSDAVSLALGFVHSCALREGGTVSCWGNNSRGQLGNGMTTSSEPVPVDVQGLSDAVEISAGTFHTCARRSTGAVVCWGGNDFGQLGDGSMAPSMTPAAVPGLTDAVSIEAGDLHACAVLSTGGLVCWGQNAEGQLGDGTMTLSRVPVAVSLSNVIEVSCGSNFSCSRRALDATTVEVSCWGNNGSGQLGDGTSGGARADPAPVIGL